MQKRVPLLFHLHGGGGTAKGTPGLTFGRFNKLADRDGFIVVYPQAIEKNWNDGRKLVKAKAWQEDIDDVGFITTIIELLSKDFKIDHDRIFSTGMSNGGFMTARLLCDRADIFRGGAIVTATLSEDYIPKCMPAESVSVMIMNGTDDPLVPYDGGQIRVFKRDRGKIVSTDEFVEFWSTKNACKKKGKTIQIPDKTDDDTRISMTEYSSCQQDNVVQLYTIHGGGHTWPGGKQYLGEKWIGKTSQDINACDVIWDFFKQLK
jgi:polyhydroxybutyrate depolymerase